MNSLKIYVENYGSELLHLSNVEWLIHTMVLVSWFYLVIFPHLFVILFLQNLLQRCIRQIDKKTSFHYKWVKACIRQILLLPEYPVLRVSSSSVKLKKKKNILTMSARASLTFYDIHWMFIGSAQADPTVISGLGVNFSDLAGLSGPALYPPWKWQI